MNRIHTRNRLNWLAATTLPAALLLAAPASLLAQTDTARVTGTVMDQTGAAIPGATVVITNLQNNARTTIKSGGKGDFSASALQPGSYRADITAPGFDPATQNFSLDISQVQAMNIKLAVGSATTSVDVTDSVPLVQTANAETGAVINDRQLSDLPLNGRNFTQLALLTPGVTRGAYSESASGSGNQVETQRYNDTGGASLSANGLRPQANNFLLDGLDNNESLVNTINFFPPVEAMSEFRVTNSLAPAEFGRAGGVVIQAATKSGTNSIHGSAFEFYRDLGLGGANENYFAFGTAEPSQHRHQFGGTIGFPILKDKLFFFADYQGLREDIPNGGATLSTVATAKMRAGDFSELLGTGLTAIPYNSVGGFAPDGCASFTTVHGMKIADTATLNNSVDNGAIFDPLTCSQFNFGGQANHIDPARLNKVGVNYLNAYPLPNHTATSGVRFNYAHAQFIDNKYNDFDIRLDYHLKSKDVMFVRYSYAQDNDSKTTSIVGVPSGFGAGDNNTHPRGVAAGETHSFTPNLINEFRFGYSRPFYGYINPLNGVPFSQNLGIPNANRTALLGGGALIGGNFQNLEYTGDGGSYQVPQHIYQYFDAMSYTHGKHAFKFGGNLTLRHVAYFQGNDAKGFFSYQGTGSDFTGYDVSEVLAGFVNTYSISNVDTLFETRTYENSYFGQDDWKISRRFTVNLGVRYDLYNFPYEINNRQSNFNLTTGNLDVAGKNGNSRSLIDTPKTNFAPRVGFAYDVFGDGKTALRGGYGIYYFVERGGISNQLSNNPDFNGISSFDDYDGFRIALSGQTATQQPANSTTPGPYAANNSTLATAALPAAKAANEIQPTNAAVIAYRTNSKIPVVQQYNLSLQQQIEKNTTVTVTFVGTKADHLLTSLGYNNNQLGTGAQFFPNRSLSVSLNDFAGSSRYSGLQTSLNHRLVNGLQVTAAYTWSHNIDDVPSPYNGGAQSPIPTTAQGPQLQLNRGNADDDQRHAATFSALIEVPYGRGRRYGSQINKGLDYLAGGWQFSPFVSIGSGTPFDLQANADSDNVSVRPDLVSNPQPGLRKDFANSGTGYLYLNTVGVVQDAPKNAAGLYTRVGTLGRNHFYGPGYNTTGISVFKAIPITGRIRSEIRGQAYNLFNHPQFANPTELNIDNTGSTVIDGTAVKGPIVNTLRFRSAREVELAYRITF